MSRLCSSTLRMMTLSLAALFLVVGGCGGDKDSGSGSDQQKTGAVEPASGSAQPAAKSGSAKFDAFIDEVKKEAAREKTVYIRVPGVKEKTLQWTEEGLQKQFGVDVTLVNDPKGWDEITAAYIAEYQAGKKDVPVIAGYGNTMFGVVEEAGALADFDWAGTFGEKWPVIKRLNEAVTWPQLRKGCVTINWRSYVLYYNTNLIKESDAPKKWENLTNPKFKGKISAFANGAPGEYLRSVWGEKKVIDWAKKVRANNPIFLENSPAIASGVASGEVGIGTINLQYAQAQVEKGAPVGWVIPEDGWVNLTDIFCTFKNASHPNLSALLAAFWAAAPEEVAGRIRTVEGWTVGYPEWSFGALPAQMKKQGLTFKDMHEVSDKETATLDRKFRDRIAKEAYRTRQ